MSNWERGWYGLNHNLQPVELEVSLTQWTATYHEVGSDKQERQNRYDFERNKARSPQEAIELRRVELHNRASQLKGQLAELYKVLDQLNAVEQSLHVSAGTSDASHSSQ